MYVLFILSNFVYLQVTTQSQ